MSNVLKRIQQVQRERASQIPAAVTQDITQKYIDDLKRQAYEEARTEINNQLIQAAESAELEGLQLKVSALETAHQTVCMMLEESKSSVAQLTDHVKSLQAGMAMSDQSMEDMREDHRMMMETKDTRIRELELALVRAESKPVQVIKQQNASPVGFEFEPVRGPNGIIQSVTAKPIYRN